MGNGLASVEVKKVRGKLTVIGVGRTMRGRKYFKDSIPTKATRTSDPKFKGELATAVDQLFAESSTDTP
jgi:hypothetical protein